jgi:hypothetical protein
MKQEETDQSLPPANCSASEKSTLKALAGKACLGIFDDFDESEIAEQPTSIRVAWQYGKELRTLYPKQNA